MALAPERPEDILDPCIPVECRVRPQASKPYRDGRGLFLKWQRGGNVTRIEEEFRFLLAMADSGVTPRPVDYGPNFLLMEDLGPNDPFSDADDLHLAAECLLHELAEAGVWHHDLIVPNLILKRAVLYAVDFGRAQWMTESVDERYLSDRDMLMKSIAFMAENAAAPVD